MNKHTIGVDKVIESDISLDLILERIEQDNQTRENTPLLVCVRNA